MLKTQEKLFFRSLMRTVLLLLWFGGSTGYYIHLLLKFQGSDSLTWTAVDGFFMLLRVCFFFFAIMALLSFDYFRELADGDLIETVRASGSCLKNDVAQFVVLLQFVAVSFIIVLLFLIRYFKISDVLTFQSLKYLWRISFTYIGANGLLAILLGWFLAEKMSKIKGYVCLLLFCILISPNMVQNFNYLMVEGVKLTKYCKVLYLMPEIIMSDGMLLANVFSLIPVQLTHICRVLFWLFLVGAGIVGCYSFRWKKWVQIVLVCGATASFCYTLQPTSYYSMNDTYDENDSGGYPYLYYVAQQHEQKEKVADFSVENYDMDIQLGRIMKVQAVMKLSEKSLESYHFTLYHLYEVDEVADQSGNALFYERDGDYLTIYNSGSLEEISITYHGGCSNYYSNENEMYLAAGFPYYPLPGFRIVYNVEEQTYVDNRQDEETGFEITFTSKAKIYSDLPEISENHFAGKSKGAVFVSGFFNEMELEGGATCIYSYMDPSCTSDTETNEKIYPMVLEYMKESGIWQDLTDKIVIFTPGIAGGTLPYVTENAIVAPAYSWEALERECEKNNVWTWYYGEEENDEVSLTRQQAVDIFIYRYHFLKKEAPEEVTYSKLKDRYVREFSDYLQGECTDEMFEQFILENLGRQELESLKEE
jgi:hypothetical protein